MMNVSEKAIQAINVLREQDGITHTELAMKLGVAHIAAAVGVVNSLTKKGITRKEGDSGARKIYLTELGKTETFEPIVEKDPNAISEKGVKVIEILKAHETPMKADEIATELGVHPIAVNGVVNGLIKRHLVERQEVTEGEKTYKVIVLK